LHVYVRLQLGFELLEDSETLFEPLHEFRLHRAACHAFEPLNLLVDVSCTGALRFPCVNEFLFLLSATFLRLDRAERHKLFDVLLHVRLAWSKFGAHGVTSLLLVCLTLVPCLFVEMSDSRPATCTRLADANLVFGQVDIAKHDARVRAKFLHLCIPFWGLLASSASAFAGDPAHHYGLACINVLLDPRLGVLGRQFL